MSKISVSLFHQLKSFHIPKVVVFNLLTFLLVLISEMLLWRSTPLWISTMIPAICFNKVWAVLRLLGCYSSWFMVQFLLIGFWNNFFQGGGVFKTPFSWSIAQSLVILWRLLGSFQFSLCSILTWYMDLLMNFWTSYVVQNICGSLLLLLGWLLPTFLSFWQEETVLVTTWNVIRC